MSRLDKEARMAMKTLMTRGATKSEIARLLQVSEGSVRYHLKRMEGGAADGRSLQVFKAEAYSAAIEHWRTQQQGRINLVALHEWRSPPRAATTSSKS